MHVVAVLVAARGQRQRVVDDEPAGVGHPARLEHVRARDVAARHRGPKAPRPDPEGARPAVEQGGEDARRVEPRQAEPLHRPVRGDQGAGVAVGEEAVVADRVEVGAGGPPALCSLRPLAAGEHPLGNAIDPAPRARPEQLALGCTASCRSTVVGSIAFDSVRTPFGERERMLGGSAVHFALAASFFTDVHVVGPGRATTSATSTWSCSRSRGVDVDRHRAGRRRPDVLLARPLRGRPQRRPHRRHAARRVRRLRAEAVGGVEARRRPVPGQHPARPPAAGARPVRRDPAGGARLDEPLDRDHARLAGRGGRRGRLRDAQRRRGADADRGAEPRARRPRADGDGPANRGRQARRVRRGAVHLRRLLRPSGLPARGRPRPHRRRRQLRRRLPRLSRHAGDRAARARRPCAARWPTAPCSPRSTSRSSAPSGSLG